MPPTTSMSATTTGITCTTACIPAKPSLSALCCSGDSSASTRARKVADCQFAMLTELSWQAKAPAHVAGQDLGDMYPLCKGRTMDGARWILLTLELKML